MKFSDLDPRWLFDKDGKRCGFIFKSPTDQKWWQSCMFAPTSRTQQKEMFNAALVDDVAPNQKADYMYTCVQSCRQDFAWTCANLETASFDTITVTPSIDGSAGGLWHGYITNGMIVGGI